MIVSLPMYDWPEISSITDEWWRGIRKELDTAGVGSLPISLARSGHDSDTWRQPNLLLSQTCGYPLTHDFKDTFNIIGTPKYAVEGCVDHQYQSLILCRDDSPLEHLSDFKGTRAAVNDLASQSGYSAFRHVIAPLAGAKSFFSSVMVSGGHRHSMAALQTNEVDICSVDPVSYALACRYVPTLVDKLRVVSKTEFAPTLPYVCSNKLDHELQRKIKYALTQAFASEALKGVRESLFLSGMTITSLSDYQRILEMEQHAVNLKYPVVC